MTKNMYQPHYLKAQDRWVVGLGGNLSKTEVQKIIDERNAKPIVDTKTLIDQRHNLASDLQADYEMQENARNRAYEQEDPNWYGRGEKYQNEIEKDEKALRDFDIDHPEVLAEIKRRRSENAEKHMWD